jgi:phosphoribosylanthranilate isomerase
MMINPMIKICGIREPSMATEAVNAGAHLIGIVFHPLSPRYVSLAQAALISHATKAAGGSPVAIFTQHTDVVMRDICEATDIQIIQLHGTIARQFHHAMPQDYQRIYVLNAVTDPFHHLDPDRDMLLLDHPDPGRGNRFNAAGFKYPLQFPWLLAGGLTPDNVAAMLTALRPDGVDVSSGVETLRGQKDRVLIKQFITNIRGQHA